MGSSLLEAPDIDELLTRVDKQLKVSRSKADQALKRALDDEESDREIRAMVSVGTCHCGSYGILRRMNTAYDHRASNFIVECDPCSEETELHWAEMWREYYSGLL